MKLKKKWKRFISKGDSFKPKNDMNKYEKKEDTMSEILRIDDANGRVFEEHDTELHMTKKAYEKYSNHIPPVYIREELVNGNLLYTVIGPKQRVLSESLTEKKLNHFFEEEID